MLGGFQGKSMSKSGQDSLFCLRMHARIARESVPEAGTEGSRAAPVEQGRLLGAALGYELSESKMTSSRAA